MVKVKVPATFDFKDYFRRFGFGGDNPDASHYLGAKYVHDAIEGINHGLLSERVMKDTKKIWGKTGEARYYCDGSHNSVQIEIEGIWIDDEQENIGWDYVEVSVVAPYPQHRQPAHPELANIIRRVLAKVESEIETMIKEEYS